MSLAERIANAVTGHSRLAIALMVLLTVMVGAGAPMVESSSSLDQFQSDTPEAEDLDYIDQHFSTGSDNTTTAQIIVRGENVLGNETLVETLKYQQALRDNETINTTLAPESPTAGQSGSGPARAALLVRDSPSTSSPAPRQSATASSDPVAALGSWIHMSPNRSSCASRTWPRWARKSRPRNVWTRLPPDPSISR